jgi:DNA-binding NarL/FixJ family response regulator
VFAIAIVDDQPIRRGGMERLVQEDAQLKVVASVAGVDDLEAAGPPADVVVLNLARPAEAASLSLIGRVADLSRPLVVSAWDQPASLLAAVRVGARACVSRRSDPAGMAAALTVVTLGGFYVCTRLREQFQAELVGTGRDESGSLAPREIETLRWIARGFTQAQIAYRMGVSEATINTYAKRIRAKLNASNKAELTRKAIQLGHLSDDRPAA